MRFKLDENLPLDALEIFRTSGFGAASVVDEGLQGTEDPRLQAACREEDRVLVTLDLDFGDIRAYPPADSPGVIVLRPPSQAKAELLRLLRATCRALQREGCEHQLWIVEAERIRIRE